MFLVALWGVVVIMRPFTPDKLLIVRRNLLFPTSLAVGFCVIATAGFFRRGKTIRTLIIGLFVVLTALDMLRYTSKWMPFDPREYVYPEVDILTFLKRISDMIDFWQSWGRGREWILLSGIEGYDAVYQKRYGEFISSVNEGKIRVLERSVVQFPKSGKFSELAMQVLGVRLLAHRLSDGRQPWTYPYWSYPNYKSIYRNKHYQIYENSRVLPRAFLASSFLVRSDDQSILDALYSERFDPKDTVVLEQEPVLLPLSGEGSVDIVKYTANEVVLQSKSAVPKLLFLSDVYDKGWHATVDGHDARIDRADYDFRAVAVPGVNTPSGWFIGPKVLDTVCGWRLRE